MKPIPLIQNGFLIPFHPKQLFLVSRRLGLVFDVYPLIFSLTSFFFSLSQTFFNPWLMCTNQLLTIFLPVDSLIRLNVRWQASLGHCLALSFLQKTCSPALLPCHIRYPAQCRPHGFARLGQWLAGL